MGNPLSENRTNSPLSAKRRTGFGDAFEYDQSTDTGQADEQTPDPNGLRK